MTSHHTQGSVTTLLHDVGGVLGRPLDTFIWALTITWSRLLACVWSGPKSVLGFDCVDVTDPKPSNPFFVNVNMTIKRSNHLVPIFLELFVGERLQCKVSQHKSVQQHQQTLIFFCMRQPASVCSGGGTHVLLHRSRAFLLYPSEAEILIVTVTSNNHTSHYFDEFIYIIFNSLVSERRRERERPVPGKFLGIGGQDPSDSKSSRFSPSIGWHLPVLLSFMWGIFFHILL